MLENVLLVIPTLNAGAVARTLMESLGTQICRPGNVVVVDSESTDNTIEIFDEFGVTIRSIPRVNFNHGGTRQLALSYFPDTDIIIYMTQDSILASNNSISNILKPFEDERVGAVCGRQLPHSGSTLISAHARLFNYPAVSSIKDIGDVPSLGMKVAFISNSFAAYRRSALIDVGGFPANVIFGEDTYVAAKMLKAGWRLAYAADAVCYHSHNYSMKEEFQRYFDIGVFHSNESWFVSLLGNPGGEGKKFVLSELLYLFNHAPWLIPFSVIRTALKFCGYKLGRQEKILPMWLKVILSMNKGYWKTGALGCRK